MKTDVIFLDRIRLLVRIGTSVEERSLAQKLDVSIRLTTSLKKSAATDDLLDSVDYSTVNNDAHAVAESREFNLVESFAEAIAHASLKHKNVSAVWVRVEKRILKSTECVGVEIWREKS